jgi:hypothetical protein
MDRLAASFAAPKGKVFDHPYITVDEGEPDYG